jgi:methionine-rich copper-binding protein CopC
MAIHPKSSTPRPGFWPSRIVYSALTALGLLLSFASPAAAHLGIDSSTPANASELRKAPQEATLTFTADVEIATASAQLRILGGPDTPIAQATNREVETVPLTYLRGEGRTVVFALPDLSPGLYALDWVVDESGGHANTSFILFKVSEPGLHPALWALPFALALAPAVLLVLRKRR